MKTEEGTENVSAFDGGETEARSGAVIHPQDLGDSQKLNAERFVPTALKRPSSPVTVSSSSTFLPLPSAFHLLNKEE